MARHRRHRGGADPTPEEQEQEQKEAQRRAARDAKKKEKAELASIKAKTAADEVAAAAPGVEAAQEEAKQRQEKAAASREEALKQKEINASERNAATAAQATKDAAKTTAAASNRMTSFIKFQFWINLIISLLVTIGIFLRNTFIVCVVWPLIVIKEFMKSPIMDKLSSYIALAIVILVIFGGYRMTLPSWNVSLPSLRMPRFDKPNLSLPSFRIPWLPRWSVKLPTMDYRVKLFLRSLNPYATAPSGYPRDRASDGRCDGMEWMPVKHGQCLRTTKPVNLEWTLDASKLKMDDLPPQMAADLKTGKLTVTMPYVLNGTSYQPSCKDAMFASGDSAAGFFEDDQNSDTCVLKRFPRTAYSQNARETGEIDPTKFTMPA